MGPPGVQLRGPSGWPDEAGRDDTALPGACQRASGRFQRPAGVRQRAQRVSVFALEAVDQALAAARRCRKHVPRVRLDLQVQLALPPRARATQRERDELVRRRARGLETAAELGAIDRDVEVAAPFVAL